VKGSSLRPIAAKWQIGCVLLLFSVAGQALAAAKLSGTVTAAANGSLEGATVVATSDTFKIARADVGSDGTYSADLDPGTYTIAVVAKDQTVAPVKSLVVKDGDTVKQDFTLKTATPFPIVKAAKPIPLTDGIDSASFQDAPEIDINSGKQLSVVSGVTVNDWGGPSTVSGRFKVKYSDQAIHLAGDVTFKAPRVNNMTNDSLWNGNALEIDIQNDPYAADRTAPDADHNWQLVVGLGSTPDWWLHDSINARPALNGKDEPISAHSMITDKTTKDGELVRIDIPWAILLDSSGNGIKAPDDNAMGAMDIAIDSVDPNATDRSTAARAYQIQWSGFGNTHWNPSSLVPIQFVPQAPATPPATGQ